VKNEREPLTIPRMGEHSGRTALVPGFMAGVQSLHDRFGKLTFATLFGPEEGTKKRSPSSTRADTGF
jgi:gamma-glutamyltranspeptidase